MKSRMQQHSKKHQRSILKGMGISPGNALGKAYVYTDIIDRPIQIRRVHKNQTAYEHQRIKSAIRSVRKDLQNAAEHVKKSMNKKAAGIFEAQEMMLMDDQLAADMQLELNQRLINAEHVIINVFRRWHGRFAKMSDHVFGQRADDVADLWRRLLRAMAGIDMNVLENIPSGSVIVAKKLLPSDTVLLSRRTTVAVVVESGGSTSHAALLTRELGIPSVSGIKHAASLVRQGESILVDGSDGMVIVNPVKSDLRRYEKEIKSAAGRANRIRAQSHALSKTVDGTSIAVMANVSCREDVQQACELGADGVGLYRLEGFYLAQKVLPTVSGLFEHLAVALEPAKDKPITVRLLDIGGDKEVPYLNLASDPVPLLGLRGIRLLLKYRNLLSLQLRVLIDLSRDMDVRILVPMVTRAEEMEAVRNAARIEARKLGIRALPNIGAMIETPAAALCVDGILKHSTFLSIGTNDLTQYALAVGRENDLVQDYFDDRHPAILKLLRLIVESADSCPVSLCGELAANKRALPDVLNAGLRTLSVAPNFVPMIKDAVRRIRLPW